MARILNCREVAASLNARSAVRAKALGEKGITPTLALIRLGEDGGALAYQAGILARAKAVGAAVRTYTLPMEASPEELGELQSALNQDKGVHGVMVFRPLPPGLDSPALRNGILPKKDVDGVTDASLSGVFTGWEAGYAPCTAQACVEILNYHGINLPGANVAVVGRSLVVGRPAAMLLMRQNATVTLCHSKTRDLPQILRRADIVIAAAGQPRLLGPDCFRPGQVVLDVGMHAAGDGSMWGDVDGEALKSIDLLLTPVLGGVGTVTTAVLFSHLLSGSEAEA